MLQSMHTVIAYVKSHGPFDCAYGFSQGGAIVALLSFPEIVYELTGTRMQLWRSVVLACSTIFRARMMAEKLWNINLENMNIRVPSFHLIGMEDMLRQEGEQAMRMFAYRRYVSATDLNYLQRNPRQKGTSSIIRSVYYIPGGHAVPSTLMRDKDFQMEFNAWFTSTIDTRDVSNMQPSNFVVQILSALPFPFLKRPNTQEQRLPENMEPVCTTSLPDSPQRSNSLLQANSLEEVNFGSTFLVESEKTYIDNRWAVYLIMFNMSSLFLDRLPNQSIVVCSKLSRHWI
eukprot:jgi/Picre1/27225/NNA_000194.t1